VEIMRLQMLLNNSGNDINQRTIGGVT
jgi:hypothetical protein